MTGRDLGKWVALLMDLFWQTRRLTDRREDHLTCFVAAALEADDAFCRAYESCVLGSLAGTGETKRIKDIQIQVPLDRCCPDMMLTLEDDRVVVCEHKLDAPETPQLGAAGEILKQLERYLELPGVHKVAYFRPSLSPLAEAVLQHPRYLKPGHADHFLWRDVYEPLEQGQHYVTRWLRRGFEKLGFTPPHAHVGVLWPDETEDVKRNQTNFGKLWDLTRSQLSETYKITRGRRCELTLRPHQSGAITRAYVSPLAQGGSMLRLRVELEESLVQAVLAHHQDVIPRLPVRPEVVRGTLRGGGLEYIDLMAPLRQVLGEGNDPHEHQLRLSKQVVPALEDVCSVR